MEGAVFWHLVPISVFDNQGRPVRSFNTDEEKLSYTQIQQEVAMATFHAGMASVALDRIGDRFDISHQELAAIFESAFVASHHAAGFARAFRNYWAGRIDESIHVALPRIEAVLRNILAVAGGIVYQEPRGESPGREKRARRSPPRIRERLSDQGMVSLVLGGLVGANWIEPSEQIHARTNCAN